MTARDLPAFRALDAEVAETVMGRRVERGVNCRMDAHGDRLDVDIGFADSLRIVWTSETYEPVPHYSTDVVAAFTVADEMHRRGYLLDLEYTQGWSGPRWVACFGHETFDAGHGGGETPALAICLASLALAERAR